MRGDFASRFGPADVGWTRGRKTRDSRAAGRRQDVPRTEEQERFQVPQENKAVVQEHGTALRRNCHEMVVRRRRTVQQGIRGRRRAGEARGQEGVHVQGERLHRRGPRRGSPRRRPREEVPSEDGLTGENPGIPLV